MGILLLLFLSIRVYAQPLTHGPSPEQRARIVERNLKLSESQEKFWGPSEKVDRPYAEYEEAQYLLMDSAFNFGSEIIKTEILKNLPANVTAVVLTQGSSNVSYFEKYFEKYIEKERLKVVNISGGFWARDSLPIPVFVSGKQDLGVVDAHYYHGYEPDAEVARRFNAQLLKHSYGYEGGNFMADSRGNCLMVDNSAASTIPETIFENYYGCQSLTRFKHVGGIGHVDERVRLISDSVAVTDAPEYVQILEKLGFKVSQLPRPNNHYETYANALLVNGTLYLPIYNQPSDQTAIQIYQGLGLKVVPLNSTTLSNTGKGSIHCITMTYPKAQFQELMERIAPQPKEAPLDILKNTLPVP